MESAVDGISLNGVEYVRKDAVQAVPTGNRCVVVADRGWIFAGDLTEKDGRIKLTRALLVQSWSGIGFDGMIAGPKSSKVVLKKLSSSVDLPADAELFRIPVDSEWGL